MAAATAGRRYCCHHFHHDHSWCGIIVGIHQEGLRDLGFRGGWRGGEFRLNMGICVQISGQVA